MEENRKRSDNRGDQEITLSDWSSECVDWPMAKSLNSTNNDRKEWLNNDSDFPKLSNEKASTINASEDDWEVVRDQEVDRDDVSIVTDMSEWSNVDNLYSYADMAKKGKNIKVMDHSRPTSAAVQRLAPLQYTKKHTNNADDDSDDMDATNFYYIQKCQQKCVRRASHISKIGKLRGLDNTFPGVLRIGASRLNNVMRYPDFAPPKYGSQPPVLFESKGEAIKFALNFDAHRARESWYDNTIGHKMDYTEFSVQDSQRKRKNESKEMYLDLLDSLEQD